MKLSILRGALFSLMLLSFSTVFLGTFVDVSWAYNGYAGDDMREFRRFLNNHPRIASDLERNPSLINNPRYLDRHDDLREFLRRHPGVAGWYGYGPSRAFGRYDRWDRGPVAREYRYGPSRPLGRYDRWDRGPSGWGYRR